MILIGITGGIGTGKSTVSSYLKDKGYHVIDADQIAREIVEIGKPALLEIKKSFGDNVINKDGSLDRKALAAIVFNDINSKNELEKITMPRICKEIFDISNNLKKSGEKIVFLDAPLLFEANLDKSVDVIWCVDAEFETRIDRVKNRDAMNREEIIARINNQMSNKEKIEASHEIIDNSYDITTLYKKIDDLLEKYE